MFKIIRERWFFKEFFLVVIGIPQSPPEERKQKESAMSHEEKKCPCRS
jgi:hypothetical protein